MKNEKVKKAIGIVAAVGVMTTSGLWVVNTENEPYIEAINREIIVYSEDSYMEKCLIFNTLEEAEAEQLRIDIIMGYAVEEVDENSDPITTYPYSTKHAYSIQKHDTKEKCMICYPRTSGMKNKKINVELFDIETLSNFKNKKDPEILEFFQTEL